MNISFFYGKPSFHGFNQSHLILLQKIVKVKSHQNFIFMKGQFEELTTQVKSYTNISAVFVNVDILKVNQVAMLQGAWQYPVFDRYIYLSFPQL